MEDLISRQAAIELIENESRKWGDEYGVSDVLCDLSDMPSAQSERKRGKWIDGTATHIKTGEERAVRQCSQCGAGYFRYDISENTDPAIPNFCPNCGADMRGDKDERFNQQTSSD